MRIDISPHIPDDINNTNLVIVGEAPGRDEVIQGLPFVGASGKFLRKTITEMGFVVENAYITNVFWERPPDNDVKYFFCTKTAAKLKGVEICENICPFKNMYLKKEYEEWYYRLGDEIQAVDPEIILAVGATPTWALTFQDKITECRGVPVKCTIPNCSDYYVVPTFHPAGVMRRRDWTDNFKVDIANAIRIAITGDTIPF